MIAGLGAWLFWLGGRRLIRLRHAPARDHDHSGHGATCDHCGHRHAPDLDEAASVHSWRAALAMVAAIAIRPCTGALFLLILTWRMGLEWAGIVGAFVMGAGTASVSLLVAVLAVGFRESLLDRLRQNPASLRAVPLIEMSVGLLIFGITLHLLLAL